jgi:hypothetical protein
MSNFWDGREPCWVILNCSKYVYKDCPAYLYPEGPCWEKAYTKCEILLSVKKDCKTCKVSKLYSAFETDLHSMTSSKKIAT